MPTNFSARPAESVLRSLDGQTGIACLVDGVIDFAAAVADPGDPDRLNPAYDSGDHLHPNAAGYRGMAAAINLGALLEAG